MLWSDWLIYILVFTAGGGLIWMSHYSHWRLPLRHILSNRGGAIASVILLFYVAIGLLDSVHLELMRAPHSVKISSLLDMIVYPLGEQIEESYSAPFSNHLFVQSIIPLPSGKLVQGYPQLKYSHGNWEDIFQRLCRGLAFGLGSLFTVWLIISLIYVYYKNISWQQYWQNFLRKKSAVAWREMGMTFILMWSLICICAFLATHYHILGTDKVGRDIFYESIKSIRTGLLLGTLTTLFMLPFALFLGTIAGFFRGWVDDIVQYTYTTLNSIPGVLLISAAVLMLQVYMDVHSQYFPSLMQRADVRLLALCGILGVTSWANLCRLLRAETLKLRELEFVYAAYSLGVGPLKIIWRHIIPNILHIVIITLVLDFSGLVLMEAVLSYVGVGVDPTTISWGNMINSSRLELARVPIVWWPLFATLIFMFGLVLSANIFADKVRDAFDPSLRNTLVF